MDTTQLSENPESWEEKVNKVLLKAFENVSIVCAQQGSSTWKIKRMQMVSSMTAKVAFDSLAKAIKICRLKGIDYSTTPHKYLLYIRDNLCQTNEAIQGVVFPSATSELKQLDKALTFFLSLFDCDIMLDKTVEGVLEKSLSELEQIPLEKLREAGVKLGCTLQKKEKAKEIAAKVLDGIAKHTKKLSEQWGKEFLASWEGTFKGTIETKIGVVNEALVKENISKALLPFLHELKSINQETNEEARLRFNDVNYVEGIGDKDGKYEIPSISPNGFPYVMDSSDYLLAVGNTQANNSLRCVTHETKCLHEKATKKQEAARLEYGRSVFVRIHFDLNDADKKKIRNVFGGLGYMQQIFHHAVCWKLPCCFTPCSYVSSSIIRLIILDVASDVCEFYKFIVNFIGGCVVQGKVLQMHEVNVGDSLFTREFLGVLPSSNTYYSKSIKTSLQRTYNDCKSSIDILGRSIQAFTPITTSSKAVAKFFFMCFQLMTLVCCTLFTFLRIRGKVSTAKSFPEIETAMRGGGGDELPDMSKRTVFWFLARKWNPAKYFTANDLHKRSTLGVSRNGEKSRNSEQKISHNY